MLKKGCIIALIWIFFGGFILVGVGMLLALIDMLLPVIAVAVVIFIIWKLFFSSDNTSTQKSERPKRNSRRRHNKRH